MSECFDKYRRDAVAEVLRLEAEVERLRAALREIEHETGETMRATNHGRRGHIANSIARAALTGGKE